MKKVIILLLMLMLLSSCNLVVKKGELKEGDITGGEGLAITLPEIPKELLVGQGLDIPITLENKGASNAENAILSIKGFSSQFVKFRTPTVFEGINLEGRSTFLPIGERTTKIFSISSITLPSVSSRQETFQVFACYQYQTQATAIVCINPRWAYGSAALVSGCTFNEGKITATQGAPIAVTKVVTAYDINQREVEFRIYVKDVSDTGVLLKSSAYDKRCLSDVKLTKDDLGVIHIDAFMSGIELNCFIGNNRVEEFKIAKEGHSVTCKAAIDRNEPGFTTPLSIDLSYGYNVGKIFKIDLKNPAIR